MKKLLVASILTIASISVANAAGENNVGCGLGSMVFNGKTGLPSQVLAATTNGSSGNQTFGISSGTLGCSKDGVVKSSAALSTFMAANFDKVSHDMAVGKGESLETMANLMGIAEQDKATFYKTTRENFDAIFVSEASTVKEVIASLGKVMANNEKLAPYTV
ncbi:hypothetical protein MNBD_GAMMA22-868 [hydrothermal vent metagenome]|uniref:DUF3015 domain-containing protein n=1 Tax=hydrothermal vent metagenome TaxID=652676 RepID=A0A3B1ATS7_9ZZZZ